MNADNFDDLSFDNFDLFINELNYLSKTLILLTFLQCIPDVLLIMTNQLDCLYQLVLLKTLIKDV